VPVEIVASQEYDLAGVAAGKPRPKRAIGRQQLVALGEV
jgi:hypothetical protein